MFPGSRRVSHNLQTKVQEPFEIDPKNKVANFEPFNMKEFSKRIGPRVSPTNYEPMNSVKKTLSGDGNDSMLQR